MWPSAPWPTTTTTTPSTSESSSPGLLPHPPIPRPWASMCQSGPSSPHYRQVTLVQEGGCRTPAPWHHTNGWRALLADCFALIQIMAPEGLDFGLCTVKEESSRVFDLVNTGQVPAPFHWEMVGGEGGGAATVPPGAPRRGDPCRGQAVGADLTHPPGGLCLCVLRRLPCGPRSASQTASLKTIIGRLTLDLKGSHQKARTGLWGGGGTHRGLLPLSLSVPVCLCICVRVCVFAYVPIDQV